MTKPFRSLIVGGTLVALCATTAYARPPWERNNNRQNQNQAQRQQQRWERQQRRINQQYQMQNQNPYIPNQGQYYQQNPYYPYQSQNPYQNWNDKPRFSDPNNPALYQTRHGVPLPGAQYRGYP